MDTLKSELDFNSEKAQAQEQDLIPGFSDIGDGTTNVAVSDTSSATKVQNTQGDAAGEAQSNPVGAFGSPHQGSPLPAQPASPLDALPAKQLDFDVGASKPPQSPGYGLPASLGSTGQAPASPATPVTTPLGAGGLTANSTAGGVNAEGAVDYDTFIKDTLLWVNKVRSMVYLLGGLLLIYALHSLFTANVSLVTGVCHVLLLSCALNFLRGFFSPKVQARSTWQDSAWTVGLTNRLTSILRGAASLHDKHVTAADAPKMLRIVLALWVISLAGRVAGAAVLAVTLWIGAFVVPKLYTISKAKIDQALTDVTTQAKGHFLKLDPKARAALVVVPIFVAGYALSSTDLAVATLALALYGRSWMAPAQVDRLNAAVAPAITNTVSKVGGTVSHLVQNAVTKFDLTPTPAKAKRA